MAVTATAVDFSEEALAEVQHHLRDLGLDAWLLYDFHGNNPIATGVFQLPPLTRRFFVLIPAEGRPIALTHRIEQQPWRGWLGENQVYLTWQTLEEELQRMLKGRGTVAIEHSHEDGVPYVDRVPAGVLELVRKSGVQTAPSGDLVSAFYSRWSAEGLESHLRAAKILRDTAHDAFFRIGEQLRAGESPTEWEIRGWITTELISRGLSIGCDAIVAIDANAANPHYAPAANAHSVITRGSLVLIDLWGKESAQSIYADQTWMAYVGADVPARIEALWSAIREGRDAGVEAIRTSHAAGEPVGGCDIDDVVRNTIGAHGFADAFAHRTGHSIDRELHGSGPNIDNLETRDTRRLITGVGFSIEPGVYFAGEVGLRTEIDVYMGPDGPVVTTPTPQQHIHRITV